jgi:hypothetical protein
MWRWQIATMCTAIQHPMTMPVTGNVKDGCVMTGVSASAEGPRAGGGRLNRFAIQPFFVWMGTLGRCGLTNPSKWVKTAGGCTCNVWECSLGLMPKSQLVGFLAEFINSQAGPAIR